VDQSGVGYCRNDLSWRTRRLLRLWFSNAAWENDQPEARISALVSSGRWGLGSYQTGMGDAASATERRWCAPTVSDLIGLVEVDETYVGGW